MFSDEELAEAVTQAKNGVVKLTVHLICTVPPAPVLKFPDVANRKPKNSDEKRKIIDVVSPQEIPSKPSAKALQQRKESLNKISTNFKSSLDHLYDFCEKKKRAQDLLATKTPANVKEARDIFMTLLGTEEASPGIFTELAKCNAVLGNCQEAVMYLVKSAGTGGISDPKEIPEFEVMWKKLGKCCY